MFIYYKARPNETSTITIPNDTPRTVGRSAPVSGTGNAVALPVEVAFTVGVAVLLDDVVAVALEVDVAVGVAVLLLNEVAVAVIVGVAVLELLVAITVGVAVDPVASVDKVVKFEAGLLESQPSLVHAIKFQ